MKEIKKFITKPIAYTQQIKNKSRLKSLKAVPHRARRRMPSSLFRRLACVRPPDRARRRRVPIF
jgi:hypothetical protein